MKSKRTYSLVTIMALLLAANINVTANASIQENTKTLTNKSQSNVAVNSLEKNKTAIPEWTKNTRYYVGDKVTHEGKIYECIVDHSRLSPSTKYVWKLIGENKLPEWKRNSKYYVGDRVTH
ncbi:MAG: hypothetical protein KID00_12525, partial [Clostridium argentinense]|nr:hypothetical protein [Clostridium argentinense]